MAGLDVSSLVFAHPWDLTEVEDKSMSIVSTPIKFCGETSFRIGLKNSKHPVLFFMALNLNKMGITVDDVIYSSSPDRSIEKTQEKMEFVDDDCETNGSVQLYKARLRGGIVTGKQSFTFKIFVKGCVIGYHVKTLDSLLREQLWLNRTQTDFELIAEGKRFPVHKFILAARSAVFATLFSIGITTQGNQSFKKTEEDSSLETSPSRKRHKSCPPTTAENSTPGQEKEIVVTKALKQKIEAVDVATMEQFLEFIYTGHLERPVRSGKLKQLAVAYQMKTLERLCDSASHQIDGNQLSSLILDWKDDEEVQDIEICPDTESEIQFSSNAGVFSFPLKLKECREKDQREITTVGSKTFEHQNLKLFRVEVLARKASSKNDSCNYELKLIVVAFHPEKVYCSIREVGYSTDPSKNYWAEPLKLKETPTTQEEYLQKFTRTDTHPSIPSAVVLHIQLVMLSSNYDYTFVDSSWENQIWGAAVANKFTDVEFLIRKESVAAHRFLLAARSPVFSAMFNSGMEETQTGQVRLEDAVNLDTFRHFLHFLYTGMLEASVNKEELFVLADKYQVETLMDLCRPATQPIDLDEFTKAFFSC